jgi:hypothetical protein
MHVKRHDLPIDGSAVGPAAGHTDRNRLPGSLPERTVSADT